MQKKGENSWLNPVTEFAEKLRICENTFLSNPFLWLMNCGFFHRSDHKDMMDEVGDNQQSGYSQCMFNFTLLSI